MNFLCFFDFLRLSCGHHSLRWWWNIGARQRIVEYRFSVKTCINTTDRKRGWEMQSAAQNDCKDRIGNHCLWRIGGWNFKMDEIEFQFADIFISNFRPSTLFAYAEISRILGTFDASAFDMKLPDRNISIRFLYIFANWFDICVLSLFLIAFSTYDIQSADEMFNIECQPSFTYFLDSQGQVVFRIRQSQMWFKFTFRTTKYSISK